MKYERRKYTVDEWMDKNIWLCEEFIDKMNE